jgi:hypothetical protein
VNALPAGEGWQPAPFMTEARLGGTFWSFGMLGGALYTPFVVLAPGGLLGIHRNHNEDLWHCVGGRLAFSASSGALTTVFDFAQVEGNEPVALAGRILVPGFDAFHQLRRVSHPAHPTTATGLEVVRRASFIATPPLEARRRPNLVVLRAGEETLHMQWPRDVTNAERNWDLCISAYSPDPARFLGQCEYLAHAPQQRKFQAIYDLFYEGSPLWNYDRIWLPDDDLMTSWADINRMFQLARRFDLDLSQPSLQRRPDCYIAHWFTGQHMEYLLRYVGFVEIMCPIFSNRALAICIGSFRDSVSGFGLDHLWPALLGGPRARMAVIDAVGVVHTRPMGVNYDVRKANAEEQAVLASYGWKHVHLPMVCVPAA